MRENGADPTLRVNLGLVYLKSNQLTRAVREFETAVEPAARSTSRPTTTSGSRSPRRASTAGHASTS